MKHAIRFTICLAGIAAMLFAFALHPASAQSSGAVTHAVAVLHPTQGNTVNGVVSFTQTGEAVQIEADITGLAPGKHGFHIHQLGDCSAPDAASAGGHFNPDGHPHAGPDQAKRHMGDMGNLEADQSGHARYERRDSYIRLNGPGSIVGHAIIVHAKADDLASQPTGNAGAREACGVIGIAAH